MNLRKLLPNPAVYILRWSYHSIFPCWIRFCCFVSDFWHAPQSLPPALLRFRVSESLSEEDFHAIGEACAIQIADIVREYGGDICNAGRVLDFGCGCGRTLIHFLRCAQSTQLIGADIDREAVDWCRNHLSMASFVVNGFKPPLIFQNSFFDLVYSVSVFTHLDEQLQNLWLDELFRVLRPGGMLILSVHGENARVVLTDSQLTALTARGILHLTSKKLSGIVPDHYYTTWHTESYIVEQMSYRSPNVKYKRIMDGAQDYIVAIKGI